jgi:hypothetical protein
MEKEQAMSRVYSRAALAHAGAVVRLNQIHAAMAYLKQFIRAESAALSNGRGPRVEKVRAKKVRAKKVTHKPVVRRESQRVMKPSSLHGVSLRAHVEDIVQALLPKFPQGVSPSNVAAVLVKEGWVFGSDTRALRSASAALRHAPNLKARKTGPARSAAVYYTVRS